MHTSNQDDHLEYDEGEPQTRGGGDVISRGGDDVSSKGGGDVISKGTPESSGPEDKDPETEGVRTPIDQRM